MEEGSGKKREKGGKRKGGSGAERETVAAVARVVAASRAFE